jgi:hypothetical protein
MMGMSAGEVTKIVKSSIGDNLGRRAALTYADARDLFFEGA